MKCLHCEDAEYIIVAYGSSARIAQKSIQLAREEGIKVGLIKTNYFMAFSKKAN